MARTTDSRQPRRIAGPATRAAPGRTAARHRGDRGPVGGAIESGGACLLRVVTGREQATELQKSFFRSGGLFFAAMGRGRERPDGAVALLGVGGVLLAAGVVTLGVGLLLG
ncbi:hypothetical protein [uncultured Cellulomonas sp.]|uniref:hypothetical protein n=1 Tax=uncultured Cellulomonas sp. TaxID=189682 RepID=UPI0028F0F748|nr:hypothetical protein [uncultured Cellulomonas sp.]